MLLFHFKIVRTNLLFDLYRIIYRKMSISQKPATRIFIICNPLFNI